MPHNGNREMWGSGKGVAGNAYERSERDMQCGELYVPVIQEWRFMWCNFVCKIAGYSRLRCVVICGEIEKGTRSTTTGTCCGGWWLAVLLNGTHSQCPLTLHRAVLHTKNSKVSLVRFITFETMTIILNHRA